MAACELVDPCRTVALKRSCTRGGNHSKILGVPVPATATVADSPPRLRVVRTPGATVWTDDAVSVQLGVDPDDVSVGQLVERLLAPGVEVAHTFKDDRKSLVRRIVVQSRPWVVKHYRGPSWKTRWCHRVRRTPAWREWIAAGVLARGGVRVLKPWALVHIGPTRCCQQALIMPFVDGLSLHHWLKQRPGSPDPQHRLLHRVVAAAIGRQIGQITAMGYVNRDHKASNLMIDAVCERGGDPCLIDPARLKRRVAVTASDDSVALMVARLWRSSRRVGALTVAERLIVMRELLRTDPSAGCGIRELAGRIDAMDRKLHHQLESNRSKRS